jgi:hypothetical protein
METGDYDLRLVRGPLADAAVEMAAPTYRRNPPFAAPLNGPNKRE